MPKVNLVAHGIQVELEAVEVSVDHLRAQALETLELALKVGRKESVGFSPKPAPDKSWLETE